MTAQTDHHHYYWAMRRNDAPHGAVLPFVKVI
jgi:hypothetical protein